MTTAAADLAANVDYKGRFAALKAWWLSPSYRAVRLYRAASSLEKAGPFGKLMGRWFGMRIVHGYGCFISPKAQIGPGLCMPHPTAVVVGEGCVLGRNVTLYQSVTLGRKNSRSPQYPVLEDNVTVYAGAVIVGPVRIGTGAIIGANTLVTRDVPAGATVVQSSSEIRLPSVGGSN